MKLIKTLSVCMVIMFIVGISFTAFSANCGFMGKGKQDDLEKKFMCKVIMLMSNEEEMDLTEDQVKNIKDLDFKTQKELIMTNAEIEVLGLEMNVLMKSDTLDTAAINNIIDKKYDLKKQKAKSLVAALAGIKSILTEEQKTKLREMYKECKKGPMKEGGMMACMPGNGKR